MPVYNVRGAFVDYHALGSSFNSCLQVTLKKDSPPEHLAKAKEQVKKEGGTIKHEYTLIKGFTAEYEEGAVRTLETNDHVHVEQDGEVKI
ncbi:hypothetical protein EYZ11_012736 [Aspergillus tanneri]|uniref:Inhibitor I9 domain-containing protein n=1 Tax=Aspergillus tanneri TaxID=1220188 RepID=A0A4S3J004_9EURO|nr:hypothetical protein EYZ11_012736 [Aspergillus tanneri]